MPAHSVLSTAVRAFGAGAGARGGFGMIMATITTITLPREASG